MLEAGVQMGLLLKAHNLLKMRVIDVGIYTEQTFEYGLHYILEVWREWSTCRISNLLHTKEALIYRKNRNIKRLRSLIVQ